jgi:hypothetical protein
VDQVSKKFEPAIAGDKPDGQIAEFQLGKFALVISAQNSSAVSDCDAILTGRNARINETTSTSTLVARPIRKNNSSR